MMALPTQGVRLSVQSHNSDTELFCDWIEASVLFLDEELSGGDVLDLLLENNLYRSQDFAWEFIESVFAVLRERARVLGQGYPFTGGTRLFRPKGAWQDHLPYAFCLMLSLASSHREWWGSFGRDYTAQGELFERLTREALQLSFKEWEVHSTGWSRNQAVRLAEVAQRVADLLNEVIGDVERWARKTAKEIGLDLLCFRPYPDQRVGVPAYLVQCASGMDWERKQHTPNLDIWSRVVQFAVKPQKALSMPFALSEREMVMHSAAVAGLLLDRHRLLEPGRFNADWLSQELKVDLIDWLTNRINVIPKHEAA